MSRAIERPKIDILPNVVEEQQKQEVVKAAEPVKEVTPVEIMKGEIDKFTKFLSGETSVPDEAKRKAIQISFIKTIENILNMSNENSVQVLTHFVRVINENRTVYTDSNVLGPVYSIRYEVSGDVLARYKSFITFILTYASNLQNRQRFLQLFDVTKFINSYPAKQAENLNMFIYR